MILNCILHCPRVGQHHGNKYTWCVWLVPRVRLRYIAVVPVCVVGQELRGSLYVTHGAPGFKLSSKHSNTAGDAAADTATARDDGASPGSSKGAGLAGAIAVAGGAASASVRSRAVALAQSLDRIGPVRVSCDRLVVPVEYLRAALQQCLLLQINDMVTTVQVSALELRKWPRRAASMLLLPLWGPARQLNGVWRNV